ncbi:hypothetical protein METBIDRAFT_44419 [Metschnikowia bicuspidata var. bicuspidata NRRL YB-4993]|uniref:Uncharacterized protein n=1 Tax=Metschnikowia bicuspidata var. bicuspidata NRRL YB-4993 TaxID=869754 RepID=A0A1A0H7E4_9ASCO|nr:hypothetical protein METBIDRAFT_44419 [Metschnikowia bicuspidata var. bicuspidata NRRL YB-4993]OBA19817.1 hypothetical protein METBIDRAFT_44419 [Metschnikowia bicuspidata var. bicuspidata NRRL YB-4993]
MAKVLKKVRALPSEPSANDVLKVEYIEVNLNNSRKLINSVTSASSTSQETVKETEAIVEDMLGLRNARAELAWLDKIIDERCE